MSECRKVRPAERYAGKQGFTYDAGIARESVGSTGTSFQPGGEEGCGAVYSNRVS